MRNHSLKVRNGVILEGWSAKPLDSTEPTRVLLYFGGRNENVTWTPQIASNLPGWTIYAFNYRSFGRSTGRPSEAAAKSDAMEIYKHIELKYPNGIVEMAVVGRSLGTSVAVWLASFIQPNHLVLLSPFDSVSSILAGNRWLSPLRFLLRQRFDVAAHASHVRSRSLILLAERDKRVPHRHSEALAGMFGSEPIVRIVPNTNHMSLPRNEQTQMEIAQFLGFAHG